MATETRTRMIETTARLLQHRGYHGTSLNDILAASGAPRGSLYFHFPGGKEALAAEATRVAIDLATEALQEALAAAPDPAEGVRLYYEGAANLLVETDFAFGCPVAPVILDAAGGVAELEALCREAFETWTGTLREAFAAAGIPGDRADSLALLAVSTLEGLLLVARAYRDTAPLRAMAREIEAIIAASMPPPGKGRARRG